MIPQTRESVDFSEVRNLPLVSVHTVANRLVKLPRVYMNRERILNTAFGIAFDYAISQWNRQILKGGKTTLQRLNASLLEVFTANANRELLTYIVRNRGNSTEKLVTPEEYTKYKALGLKMLKAFQQTPAFGKPRPEHRLVIIGGEYGLTARGDFIDRDKGIIFEVKSTTKTYTLPRARWQVLMYLLAYPEVERGAIIYFEEDGDEILPRIEVIRRDELDEASLLKIEQKVAQLARKSGRRLNPYQLRKWKILEIPSLLEWFQ
ncbi:PD-(D/E)XK nuclease family protein [Palaeococcus ferrophilus]|uniref:PD-(D/E)XK nuclease family protein n=1 Tax=Palaeococcus ferrophilus TaxID=83868 RepID=UPI00064F7127|nr:PD-(D/E)XK nuclease family protein [Palaeococcus ferrophilus]